MRKAIIAVVILLLPAVALADLVVVEKVSSTGGMGMWKSGGTETTYIKGDKVRTDSDIKVEGMMQSMMPNPDMVQTYIVRMDKKVIWTLDSEEKTYTEMSFEDMAAMAGEAGDVEGEMDVQDVVLTETGETKTIAGYKCKGILVEAVINVEAEGSTTSMDADAVFWAAKEDKKLKELMKLWDSMMDIMNAEDSAGFGSGMKALWDKFNEIDGVPLGMELTVDTAEGGDDEQAEEMKNAMNMMKEYMKSMGKEVEEEEGADAHFMSISREVVSIEEKSTDDSLFEIPAGYIKVEADWPAMPEGMPTE
jgi:hypothetical protein